MKERTSANDAINSLILGDESIFWKHKYIDGEAVPYCDVKNKEIYSPKFGPIMSEKDDMLVRGKNLHEAAHARLTPDIGSDPGWSPVKKNIINALEDIRIEKAISQLNPVIQEDIYGMNAEMEKSVSENFRDPARRDAAKPINEALAAMMFKAQGLPVSWEMSEMAKAYVEKAFSDFEKVKDIANIDSKDGFYDVLKIADKIYEDFEEAKREKEEEKEEDSKDKSDKSNGSDGSGDSDGSDDKKSENNEEDKNDGNGSGDSEDKKSDDKDSEDGSDGRPNDEEDPEGESDGSGDIDDREATETDDNGKSSKDDKAKTGGKERKKDGTSEESHFDSKNGGEKKKVDIEEDNGEDLKEEILKEKLKNILEQSLDDSNGYTSYSGGDKFVVVKENVKAYEEARNKLTVQIGRLSNYVEEALKSLSRCRKMSNLERGKIDKKKLSMLSKSLTKKVFYKTTEGIDLDVSCTILVDESGSIGYMAYQLRTLAIAFSEVFEKIGVNFEVLGFTTVDWDTPEEYLGFDRGIPIKMKVYKTFSENYNLAKYRLGGINSEKQNADGESLLYAYQRIKKEHTKRKIIFVLSDGVPACDRNNNVLAKHLRKVVKDIRNNGDEVYAFGIGTNGPEEFYGKDYFVYLKSCDELGPVFFNRFKDIVAKK